MVIGHQQVRRGKKGIQCKCPQNIHITITVTITIIMIIITNHVMN